MKNSVSGFLQNELVVLNEAWTKEKGKGLLELGHLFEMEDASGSGNGKAATATDEGCLWGKASEAAEQPGL